MLLTTKQAEYGGIAMEGNGEDGEGTTIDDFFLDYNYLNDDLKTCLRNAGITLNELLLMNDEQILLYNKVFNDNELTSQLRLLIDALKDYKSKINAINGLINNQSKMVEIRNIVNDIYQNEKYIFILAWILSGIICILVYFHTNSCFIISRTKICNWMRYNLVFILLCSWGFEAICFIIYFICKYKTNICIALFLGVFAVPGSIIAFGIIIVVTVIRSIVLPLELMYRPYQLNIIAKIEYKQCKTLSDLFEAITDKRDYRFIIIWIFMLGFTWGFTILLAICGLKRCLNYTLWGEYIPIIWLLDYIIILIGLYCIVGWKLSKSISLSFILMIMLLGCLFPFTILGIIVAFASHSIGYFNK